MDKNPKIHVGHWERTRKRLLHIPTSELSDIDVLEGLLQFVYVRADTNEIARNLLHKFKNISTLSKASVQELMSVTGVGETSAQKIVILFRSLEFIKLQQSTIQYETPTTTFNAYQLISKYFTDYHTEQLQAFYLDTNSNLLHATVIGMGSSCDVNMDYNAICEQAQRYQSSKVIIAHNHPTGDCRPSVADYQCTSRLYGMLRSIDIRLVDHIILANDKFFSFNSSKILPYIAEMYDRLIDHTIPNINMIQRNI